MILDIYRKAYDARYKPCEHAAAHLAGLQAVAEAVRSHLQGRGLEDLIVDPVESEARQAKLKIRPGDLVQNARYDHPGVYPAFGESAYVQAVDGVYLDFGHGTKLLHSLFDLASHPGGQSAGQGAEEPKAHSMKLSGRPSDDMLTGVAGWLTQMRDGADNLGDQLKASAALYAVRALLAPAQPARPLPDSLRALSEAASEDWYTNEATPYILGPPIDGDIDRFEVIARGPHGHAKSGDAIRKWQANRMFAVAAVKHVRSLLASHPGGQSEQPILRVTVDVFADRTDTRLTFGDRIRPEPGVKAVEQAIAALTAEYEARGGCPAVGRHPVGPSTGQGVEWYCQYNRSRISSLGKCRSGVPCECWMSTPDSTRTGQGEGVEPLSLDQIEDAISYSINVCRNDSILVSQRRLLEWRQGIRAALAARPVAPEAQGVETPWRPIATAPRKGTLVMLGWWCDVGGDPRWIAVAGWYEAGPADRCWYAAYDEERVGPTHWQPLDRLPAPPASSGQGGR